MLQVKKLSSFETLAGFDFSSVGFFQTPEYLKIFIKHFCKEEHVILLGVYENDQIVGYGVFENVEGVAKFLGMKKVLNGNELTDYGDIVISKSVRFPEAWSTILEWLGENGYKRVELDYTKNFQAPISKFQTEVVEQEVVPFLDLPSGWEEYINNLEYKNRRELRRKMNRLDKEKPGMNLYRCFETSNMPESELKEKFQEFVRLIKLSERDKEKFMTKEMEEFFWDLVNIKNCTWKPVLNFLQIDNKNAAVILTFENGLFSLAYNSGYDPEFNYFSPGLLSHAFKIRDLISKNYKKYDFLRGKERYKFDLGGKEEKLYKIDISL